MDKLIAASVYLAGLDLTEPERLDVAARLVLEMETERSRPLMIRLALAIARRALVSAKHEISQTLKGPHP